MTSQKKRYGDDAIFNLHLIMKTLLLLLTVLLLAGCTSTKIEHATFHGTTINQATWKSQAGVDGGATIEATTAPKTKASVTGQ